MGNDIVLKSNRNGLTLYINPDLSFEELEEKVREKFRASAKFFGASEMALEINGHNLNSEEVIKIVDIISEETEISISTIVNDSVTDSLIFEKSLEGYLKRLNDKVAEIHYGNVAAGEDMDFKNSVLIIGNVEKGAKVHSNGSIFVLGELCGSAYAGELGNTEAVIAAADFNAENAIIADLSLKIEKNDKNLKNEKRGFFDKKAKNVEVREKKTMLVKIVDNEVSAEELCLEIRATV